MRTSSQAQPSPAGAPDPVPPRWRDGALVGVLVATAIVEATLRPDLPWPLATAAVTIVLLAALPWRRSRPLLVVALTTVVSSGFAVAQSLAGIAPHGLATALALLLVPYALFRWGSARSRSWGAGILGAGVVLSILLGGEGLPGAVAAVAFVGGACLIGALRRERVGARARELDAVRSREREALARDLHDTVAHHVTTIAIRAQVARTVAQGPDLVSDSLDVIEREAQAVLGEMRSLVRTLRGPADYAPSPGLAELAALTTDGPPAVSVRVDALPALPDLVATTLFRIGQEGVTNARRHAQGARAIDVRVSADQDAVHMTVRDDGTASRLAPGDGHGIQGMSERAALLGGSVVAGPDPDGGWTLRSTLPLRNPR